jgi:hypothetical protein
MLIEPDQPFSSFLVNDGFAKRELDVWIFEHILDKNVSIDKGHNPLSKYVYDENDIRQTVPRLVTGTSKYLSTLIHDVAVPQFRDYKGDDVRWSLDYQQK